MHSPKPHGAAHARQPDRRYETGLAPAACTSIQNANSSIVGTHLVCVTHPFHPLSGQRFVCVGERYNRYGTRL
ncbi:MAG: Y4bD/Y4pK family protein, partial [Candidatus Eisenbacteria bacterium]|nr:Y4bD/Y4pK family protein [Candidatus Eisenbacteria bacterium]